MESVAIFYSKNKRTGYCHHPSIDIIRLQPAVVTIQRYTQYSDTNSLPFYSRSFLLLTVFCTAVKIYFSTNSYKNKLIFLPNILTVNHVGIAVFIRSLFEVMRKQNSRRLNKINSWQMGKQGMINNCKLIY